MDQPGKVTNPARGQLNRENNIPLSPFAPENCELEYIGSTTVLERCKSAIDKSTHLFQFPERLQFGLERADLRPSLGKSGVRFLHSRTVIYNA